MQGKVSHPLLLQGGIRSSDYGSSETAIPSVLNRERVQPRMRVETRSPDGKPYTFENTSDVRIELPGVHLISKPFRGSSSPSLSMTLGDFASTRATGSPLISAWKSTADFAIATFCSGSALNLH